MSYTTSDNYKKLSASAHERTTSASAVNMTKMPANKRAFGVDVSNARKEVTNVQNAGGVTGFKKNNIENVNPNVVVDNVKATARTLNGGQTNKTQQVALNTVKPATGSVAQATYPANGAQAARPRALSKRAINNTIFRDEENPTNGVPSIEMEGAPAPPAHQVLVAPRQVQSQPTLRVESSTDGNAVERVDHKVSDLVDDDLSPALARLGVSSSLSASPTHKATVPTADGGLEVWDSDMSDHTDDDEELDQGYGSGQDMIGLHHYYQAAPTAQITAHNDRKLEVAAAFVQKAYTKKEEQDDLKDISMAAEYADDIFAHMSEIEAQNIASANYMEGFQTEIRPDMRRVLMDWIIQVHGRFNMLPETLYLCVNYIDRFLAGKVVSLAKLQLVGATALLLAAKVEEVNAPTIPEIIYMVDDTYGSEEILKAEKFMLLQLGWKMQFPGPMSFLRRISKADDYDIEIRTMAKYLLEVIAMDYRFVAVPPSFAAAGAVCLAREMLEKGKWTPAHTHYSGYTGDQLHGLCSLMVDALREDPNWHHNAVYEKYAHRRYNQYSIKVQEVIQGTWTGRRFSLPMTLDDGKIFDYEEECDGITAYHRGATMASLGMTQGVRSTVENIFRRTQAQHEYILRQQQQAQAQALFALAPYNVSA